MEPPKRILPPHKGEPIEYEYTVDVTAWEAFVNLMRGNGISLPDGNRVMTFRSERRLDLKNLRLKGLLRSYSVARLVTSKEVVETG